MALPSARLASFREVPVVDLSAAWQGTAAARRRLAEEIVEACERVGFLYIAGHRVEPGSIDGIFAMARRFFALPLAEKMRVSFAGSRHFRGYLPLGAKGSVKQPEYENLHEGFQIYAELAADDPDVLAGKPLHGPNLWPPALPELRLEILRYHGALAALGCAMLRLFALGLGLEEEFFLQFYRKPLMQLRLLRYPPPDPALHARHLGVRAHSDTGAFTILAQDDTGGLEVMNREEEWIAVPPRAGSFVVNIGEMMKVWTDGRFSSNVPSRDQPLGPRALLGAVFRQSRFRGGHRPGHPFRGPPRNAALPQHDRSRRQDALWRGAALDLPQDLALGGWVRRASAGRLTPVRQDRALNGP